MNKLYVLLSFFTLFFIHQALPVIVGVTIYKVYRPSGIKVLVIGFDSHHEHEITGVIESEKLLQHKKDFVSLTNKLKNLARNDQADIFCPIEVKELERARYWNGNLPFLLDVPMVDSIEIDMKQKNFEYIWYDLRDKQDSALIQGPDVVVTPEIRLRLAKHREDALTIINNATLSQKTKSTIKRVLKITQPQNISIRANLIRCLSRDSDAYLITKALEKIDSQVNAQQGKTVIVFAAGGVNHMRELDDVAREEGMLLVEQKGLIARDEISNTPILKRRLDNFNDIILEKLDNKYEPLLPKLRPVPKKEILPLRIIDSPMQRELLPEMPLQELPSKLRERRARIRPFVLC